VIGNVMEGVAEKQAILDRYNELMMNYSDETADEGGSRTSSTPEPVGSRQPGRDGDGSAALPAGDADVSKLSGGEKRRVALCAASASPARPDAARRADQPPRRRKHRLAGKAPARISRRLIITHDRYFLDNVTGWILELDRGRGIPYEGNYTAYLSTPRPSACSRRAARMRRVRNRWRRAGVDCRQPEGAPGQVEGAYPAYDELVKAAGDRRPGDQAQIVIPTGERLGNVVIDAKA
jgi:ATPase subunit of ABC transporter with duplicated ATPase domains